MRMFFKIFFGIISYTLLLFNSSTPAHASEEFTVDYKVTYEALVSGNLVVNQEVSLTNKLSDVYATEYSLILEGAKPKNIKGYDAKGPLKITTSEQNGKSIIKVSFNEEIVGKGKTQTFTLGYEALELFHQIGQIREITIPKVSGTEEIDSYQLVLKVPVNFGKPAYISPTPFSQKIEGESQFFYFSKDQVKDSGIVSAFGNFQIFDFSFTYHLYNSQNKIIKTEIALPPDTPYQKIFYSAIEPEPAEVKVDFDGNWLASYLVKPKEKIEIKAIGYVKITAQPETKIKNLQDKQLFLIAQKYWEVGDPEIINLAQKLKTPKAIHNFVVSTLEYDYSRVREGAQRLGAKEALVNPDRAICMEYTDLFVTLARAAGIPARELNGYAYTTNPYLRPLSLVQDILHSWPEYWDESKQTWVQIDPTWQDTTGGIDYFSKLDLGHFVFAVHGQDSQYPPPAGAYKLENYPLKDIQIDFGKYKEPAQVNLKVDFLFPEVIFSEKSKNLGKIIIKNLSQEAVYNVPALIEARGVKLTLVKEPLISTLPPYGNFEIPVSLSSQSFLASGEGQVLVTVKNQKFEHSLKISSFIISWIFPGLGIILLLVIIVWVIFRIKKFDTKIPVC